MQSVQDDIDVAQSSTYDSEEDSAKPQLVPLQTTGLTSDGPDEALAFDEPSSALASRVLSAHGNPSPPPSPLRGGELSLMSEQLSISPVRASTHLPAESVQLESEGTSHDASDAEVENSLVLLSPLPPEAISLQPIVQEQTVVNSEDTREETTSGSPIPDQTPALSDYPQPDQEEGVVEETVAEPVAEPQDIAIPPEEPETELAPPIAGPVSALKETEQFPTDAELQSPRRSTRPRRSTTPFTLQAFTSLPGTPLRHAEKQPAQRTKTKAKTPEKGSPRVSVDVAALKHSISEEKKQRRKERAKVKGSTIPQEVGLLSPGSSALLSQLLSSPSIEDANPFDDSPRTLVPSNIIPDEASVIPGPSNQMETSEDKLAPPSTPTRFPIRPTRPPMLQSPTRSPSPRRVPLSQAPASVRKVRFPEGGPSRLQAPLFMPAPDSPTRKSPVKPSRVTPAQSTSIESRTLPPLPAPESSHTPQLPFPLIASKPLSHPDKSRAQVSTNVDRRPSSRIPRITSKPYSNRTKPGTSALKTGILSPVKKRLVSDQIEPEVRLSSPAPEPSTTIDTVVPETTTPIPLKRKRNSNVSESLLTKRAKLLSDDEADAVDEQATTSAEQPLFPLPILSTIPADSSTEPDALRTPQPSSPSVESAAQKPLPPSPPQQASQPRRTARPRKTAQPTKVATSILPLIPRQRKPPAVRIEPETFAGLTIAAFRQLTTTNTTKNQEYAVANIETEVVKVEGPRPDSPTTKVRTSIQKQKGDAVEERSARAERRARRSGDFTSDEAEEEEEEQVSTPPRKHARGPGEEEDYETPKRAKHSNDDGTVNGTEGRRVRWNRGLSTTIYLDELEPKGKAHSDAIIKKGCLANSSKTLIERLDALGNVPNVTEKVENLVQEHIIVKKFVYDEDIPEPAPAKATRSKSKK